MKKIKEYKVLTCNHIELEEILNENLKQGLVLKSALLLPQTHYNQVENIFIVKLIFEIYE